ncbi:MAG: preprotein translocase subunit SecG [Streptococcaceae bacterium]|jgi:preprotein translocase subunit SecG|nr:preprotein translocase subunit SecG [Streptococcaceae bacterium]
MRNILLVLMLIISVVMVVTIMMQPSKQNSAASAFTGGADSLFGKQKARGFEAVMQKTTAILGAVWLLCALGLMLLASN